MKVTILKPVEIEVSTVSLILPVRYWTQDIPIDFPVRRGDVWEATVDIDTAQIRGWPKGVTGQMRMKVCDSGTYILRDPSGVIVATL